MNRKVTSLSTLKVHLQTGNHVTFPFSLSRRVRHHQTRNGVLKGHHYVSDDEAQAAVHACLREKTYILLNWMQHVVQQLHLCLGRGGGYV